MYYNYYIFKEPTRSEISNQFTSFPPQLHKIKNKSKISDNIV